MKPMFASFRPLLVSFLIAVFAICGFQTSRASLAGYGFAVSTGSASDMTGATNIWVGTNQNRFFAASGVLNIGFTFQFNGISYTQMQVYTTGVISLGSNTLNRYPFNDLTNTNIAAIAPFWDSLAMTGTQGGCFAPKIRYKVLGSSPNRVLVVEWFDQETIWGKGSRGTFQTRLYESNGKVEFYYQSMNYCATCGPQTGQCGSTSASIGLADGLNNFVSVTPNNATATSSTSTADNNVDISGASTGINANSLYTFTPNIQLAVVDTLNFGTVSVGLVSTACVKVYNAGTAGQLIFQAPSISGASEFTVSSTPSAPIGVGDSGLFCIDIAPGATGIYTGILTLNSNGLDSGTQQVQLMANVIAPTIEIIPIGDNATSQLFRNARVRLGDSLEQCFIVRNSGAGLLFISQNSYIDGDYPAYYRISRIPSSILATGEQDTMCVTYAPQEEGLREAMLHIVSNAGNGTQDMQLRGVGVRPCIAVTPSPVAFDSVIIGDSVCQQITVENPCTDTLILRAITVSADPDFIVGALVKRDSVIPPGQSRTVTVCFKPLVRGSRQGRIVFFTNIPLTFEDPQRDTSIFYVDLGGTGVPIGRLYADIEGLGFKDSTLIGRQICRQDTIFNIGEGDFLLTQAMIRGLDSADYTLSGVSLPVIIKAKSFIVLTICAKPSLRGDRPAQLFLYGNSNDIADSIVANLNVKGLLACAMSTPDSLFTAPTFTSNSDTATVTVTNCGDVPATYAGVISGPDAGDYSLVQPSVGVVPANGTGTFTVVFHPLTRGVKNAVLNISAPDVPTMKVILGGEGVCAVPTAAATVSAPNTATALTNPIFFYVPISNSGNIAWNLGTPVLTGDTVFQYVAAGSATSIPAGGVDSIKIAFHPHEPTTYHAQITFPESGPCAESELIVNLVGEGFTSSVKDIHSVDGYILEQNIPNPTNGLTSIRYSVPEITQVHIVLADITGKTIKDLVNTKSAAGTYEIQLATDGLSSGTYLYIMEAGKARLVRQLIVTK